MKIIFTKENANAFLDAKEYKGFLLLVFQFILLITFCFYYGIEKNQGFPLLLLITFPCFLLHAFLPVKWRHPLLICAFTVTCIWSMGWVSGSCILIVSTLLFICAELPVKLIYRIILIAGITVGMIILRTEIIFAPRAIIAVPYVASLFMFRLISYLYYKKRNFPMGSLMQRLNYFFLLPNLCFLLFPIIDYRNFIESYYSKPALKIYQKGLYRITSGVVLLMLHRVIYFYFSISPQNVRNLTGVIAYNFISYILIIQIVGIFQICVGWVTLFGHDLSPIFENFFFAKGFSDLWRKINSYWRDFMTKVFYFPLFFRLRKLGQYPAIAIAGILSFFCSWMMHSQQLFWITGKFSFSPNDAAYWMTMGIFITADGIYQYRNSGRNNKRKFSIPVSIFLDGLKITGIFLFASLLWTMWNSDSMSSWFFIMKQAVYGGPHQILIAVVILFIAVVFAGTYLRFFKSLSLQTRERNQRVAFPVFANLLFVALIAFHFFAQNLSVNSKYAMIADQITRTEVNDVDREIVDLGYYDQLVDNGGISRTGWQFRLTGDLNWNSSSGATHRTGDILIRVFNPNANVFQHHYHLHINSMGLRDQEYSVIKPAGTTRWAFLGGSYVMGQGLEKEQTFEAMTEKHLNDSLLKAKAGGLEILNFSHGGYLLPQDVGLCKQKVFNYEPDAVFYFAHPDEITYTKSSVAALVAYGANLENYPQLQKIIQEAGLKQSQSKIEMQRLLEPYQEELIRWGYKSIADDCKLHHAKPIWVFLPTTTDNDTRFQFLYLSKIASEYGFTILDLSNVYANHKTSDIQISEINTHPNALGHQLIEQKLEMEIRKKILVPPIQQ